MFKDNDESKLQCEDVPVHRRQVSLLIPETFVVTVRLERIYFIKEKSLITDTDSPLVCPVFCRSPGQGELDKSLHLAVTVVVSVHQLGDEVACEGNEKGLRKCQICFEL